MFRAKDERVPSPQILPISLGNDNIINVFYFVFFVERVIGYTLSPSFYRKWRKIEEGSVGRVIWVGGEGGRGRGCP